MTKDETIKGDCSVSLIRENEDGSADYQFDFPPEALAALTRLGILTAIKAGIAEAECLNPDTPPLKQWAGLTNGEIQDAALVAAAEREACAGLCDRFANRMMSAEECADAIRARENNL
jgi:hypothetical protein